MSSHRGFAGQPLCGANNMLGTSGAPKQRPSKMSMKRQKMLQGGCGLVTEICGRPKLQYAGQYFHKSGVKYARILLSGLTRF